VNPVFWNAHRYSELSGIGTHLRALYEQFVWQGLAPTLIGFADDLPSDCKSLVLARNEIHSSLDRLHPLYISKVQKALKAASSGPHLLHCFHNFDVPIIRLPHQKIVLTVHDVIPLLLDRRRDESFRRKWSPYRTQFRHFFPGAVRQADKILCVSNWTAERVKEYFPEVAEKIVIVPNGYSRVEGSRSHRPRDDEVRLLSIGRYEPYKRLSLLLKILDEAPETWRLWIVTDRLGQEKLRREQHQHSCWDRVKIFTGIDQIQIGRLYGEADLYLHPSLFEGFGLPVVEALSQGLPALFVRGSALDDVINPPTSYALNPTAGASEWIDKIRQLIKSGQESKPSGKIEKKWCGSQNWKSSALSIKKLYNDILQG
jgi:glycosyltransferase involved in cell wall biosynthesis